MYKTLFFVEYFFSNDSYTILSRCKYKLCFARELAQADCPLKRIELHVSLCGKF